MQSITSIQRAVLANFSSIPDSDKFYLTGGTALAYFYLKHRKSNDLDFFTSLSDVIVPFSHSLEKTLGEKGFTTKRQRSLNSFVEFIVQKDNQSTIVQLAQDSPFHFEPPKEFEEFPSLKVDPLVDIASNKLLALFNRAVLRDFLDIYFLILKGEFSKEALIEGAKKKDAGFDLYWLGVAFERIKTYQEGHPEAALLLEPLSIKELQTFFLVWRGEIVQGLKPK